jgi:hypothetical protein
MKKQKETPLNDISEVAVETTPETLAELSDGKGDDEDNE